MWLSCGFGGFEINPHYSELKNEKLLPEELAVKELLKLVDPENIQVP